MKIRSYGRLISVAVGGLTLVVALSALFSLAQPGLSASVSALPQMPTFSKVSHLACPDCFTYACPECYVVFEEVPGTGVIITREIPNPAPREPGEVLLEVDPETGLPIWYIGRQPYVGPTDEEPFSDELLIPKIVLKRIQARYRKELSSIPGVNAFGIGARGFVVFLDPKHPENEFLVPKELEGIPVEVQLGGPFQTLSHNRTVYRPVPTGSTVGAFRPEGANGGTLGPHIVLRNPSRIWSLTASHVVMRPSELASQVVGRNVYQPDPTASGYVFWGVVAQAWRKTPCAHPPSCTGDPANFSSVTPDVVAIAHMNLSHTDTYPHRALTDPEDTNNGTTPSQSPRRRMYYGTTSFVNGPSGIVEQIRQGKEIKWWGAFSCCPHAPVGRVTATNMEAAVFDFASNLWFKYSALDFVNLERRAQLGDSGGLVAGNGTGNRHIFGTIVGFDANTPTTGVYHAAVDIQAALINANVPFDHWWGTASGRSDLWSPADTQCDGSC